jgi:hypothetical protein
MRISIAVAATIMAVAGMLAATGTAATAFYGMTCHTPRGNFCFPSCRGCLGVCGPICNLPKAKKQSH